MCQMIRSSTPEKASSRSGACLTLRWQIFISPVVTDDLRRCWLPLMPHFFRVSATLEFA